MIYRLWYFWASVSLDFSGLYRFLIVFFFFFFVFERVFECFGSLLGLF